MSKTIRLKTPQEIELIRIAGKHLNQILLATHAHAAPWVQLIELEQIAQQYLDTHNLIWAFKWYGWFPANLCLSVNNCVVHGIPDTTILKDWDLLKIDCWVIYQGMIADAAVSKIIWWAEKNPQGHALMVATKQCLDHAITKIKNGYWLYAFGREIEQHLNQSGFTMIHSLTGHGVGHEVHEAPSIYNYPDPKLQQKSFKTGMVVAIEPITAITSTSFIEKSHIPRNLYTSKGDLWCQWEYTLAVTDAGIDILAWIIEDLWK